ncbi:unnamed protein product [Rotaria sp. Silwood1]|nr:unnamed protein product [Rotaria sp. Silwood1]CAF1269212.1 unnamed protein product [Rotaria sp. Silwood1]CAF3474832.1 unnamed protein product [Rotaria sp. Silwood1]CAF4645214.1 unnamed protein product [Rotaria sp. Silwood1]CAF4963275.1 unnamed protein product [Rotaria sp. Silwood1]
MMFIIPLFLIHCLTSISAKVTYFNLENIYGPYCNPRNTYTPDAGVVRYAGTPWTGTCELNLQSCCFPAPRNLSQMGNIAVSTRFYIRLLKPPLCSTEDVTIISESGEKIFIDCNVTDGSEYYLDTEKLTIIYDRREKFPLSPFAMIVTPLKIKTRMFTLCGFDCFTDTYCIDRSLLCDRFQNCPNNVDEAHCEYHHNHPSLSLQAKIILLAVLLTIISFDVFSILICYFCCGISNQRHNDMKDEKRTPTLLEEGAAVATPLLQSTISTDNNQSH